MTPPRKTAFIKTYGCQMNVYDSDRMREQVQRMGYGEATKAEGADLVIFNTCHIREHAAEKVYSELGRMRRMKQAKAAQGGEMLVAVAGCVAQAEGEEIVRRAKAVDLVFGPQTYHRLPELIARRRQGLAPVVATEFAGDDKFETLAARSGRKVLNPQVSAFLTVQEGCDKFCTFCVVPYTRGAEFSRPVAEIASEARQLADAGVRELTLLGQNVNAYHGANGSAAANLAELIAQLSQIDGIARIRYMTSHPNDMDDSLIVAHADNPKLMPFLHLPVQSGSNRILKAMNRNHDAGSYLNLVSRIRRARPDIALSGDFIVGFPGETEEDFAATLRLAEAVGYAGAYTFKYSARPGTPAAEIADQVPEEVATARLLRLQALIFAQQTAFNQACLGRALPVLLEKAGREPGQLVGRSPYLQAVHVQGEADDIGIIRNVTISSIGTNTLLGHYSGPEAVNQDVKPTGESQI
jgi:tRNA-2-methylthio-N6-dimethylallyladenosine synthase